MLLFALFCLAAAVLLVMAGCMLPVLPDVLRPLAPLAWL